MSVNMSKKRSERFWKLWRDSGAVKFDQQNHPELREGEVWITNEDSDGFHHIRWETKRAGKVAYNSFGKPITPQQWPGSFPVFAQASELAHAGVMVRTEL